MGVAVTKADVFDRGTGSVVLISEAVGEPSGIGGVEVVGVDVVELELELELEVELILVTGSVVFVCGSGVVVTGTGTGVVVDFIG